MTRPLGMTPAARQIVFINTAHTITHYSLLILPTAGNDCDAMIELVDDVEQLIGDFILCQASEEYPSDPDMGRGPPAALDQRIGGLLNTVVQEFVRTVHAHDEVGPPRIQQRFFQFFTRPVIGDLQSFAVSQAAHAGKQLEQVQGAIG